MRPPEPTPPEASEILTTSPEATFELGVKLGREVKDKGVFLLSGDLGAGKTILAKGIAAGLDIDPADVTSPSFTLINPHEGRLRLYHVDLYRLPDGATSDLGLEEILEEVNTVVVIEWAERMTSVPAGAKVITIEYLDGDRRKIVVGS